MHRIGAEGVDEVAPVAALQDDEVGKTASFDPATIGQAERARGIHCSCGQSFLGCEPIQPDRERKSGSGGEQGARSGIQVGADGDGDSGVDELAAERWSQAEMQRDAGKNGRDGGT